MKKALKILLVLAALGAVGYFGYGYYERNFKTVAADAAAQNAYQQVTISKGDLSKSITGTGQLSIGATQDVALDYGVTVTGTVASPGDVVQAGRALLLVDKDALQTTIDTLQAELDTTESDMSSISNQYSSTAYVKAPLTGRVKEVYVEEGRKVEDVMAEKGSIALMSLDGKMYVEVTAAQGMEVTSKAKVKVGRTQLDGVVRELNAGVALITFSDAYAQEGQEVEVLYNQASLGTGQAHISLPYSLTTTQKGYVSAVYLEPGQKKWEGNRLLYLINVPVSGEYTALQNTRSKLMEQIAQAKAMLQTGSVDSPIDGIVSSLAEVSSVQQEAKAVLASLYVGDQKQMIVAVDELDITNVQEGQAVSISFDALEGVSYQGQVTHVSHIGTASSGVTTYDVTVDIQGDEKLKIGMNGTAVISVQEVKDTLLVPIAALNTSREGQYVWLYDPDQSAESDEPGVKTFLTTGMSDENYAQVLSGLSEGDVVMVTREAGSGGTNRFMNLDGGGMMFNMGGGEVPPSGGGNVRFGGGSRSGGGN